MSSIPKLPWSNADVPDLLSRAAALLSHEVSRMPGGLQAAPLKGGLPDTGGYHAGVPAMPDVSRGLGSLGGRTCPVVGAKVPLPGAQKADLRQQAHELLSGLFAAFGQYGGNAPGYAGQESLGEPWPNVQPAGARACPVTKASPTPFGGFDKDQLRRQAHEFIDTLLVTFREATDEDGVVAENKVPLIQCAAPVQAGNVAICTVTVANEEPSPSEVSLYCTNFTTDSGYEIPSLRVSSSPRVASIPPGGQVSFEIKISVPAQTPTGTYSGLIQAMGSKYVKAVLSVQVL